MKAANFIIMLNEVEKGHGTLSWNDVVIFLGTKKVKITKMSCNASFDL